MKLARADNFLTKGSYSIQDGDFVAVGIHSSSEVDACDILGVRLGIGSIVPIPHGGLPVTAIKIPIIVAASFANPQNGNTAPNEKLVLQLYEKCDPIVAPGPRAPYEFMSQVAAVGTTAAAPTLIARVPFMGRRQCTFFVLSLIADCNVVVRGLRYATRDFSAFATFGSIVTEMPVDTVWNGSATQPVSQVFGGSVNLGRAFHIGGGGDNQEAFDELDIYCYSAGGGAVDVRGTAFGERVL